MVVRGSAGNDRLVGSAGNDTIRGNGGDDIIDGGAVNDVMIGGAGDDLFVDTNPGRDNSLGGAGHDAFFGGPTTDVMNGGPGDDFFVPGVDGAAIIAGTGNDKVLGPVAGVGADGDDGNDWLEGRGGSDALTGDTLAPLGIDISTPGEDILIGGDGVDALDGGGRSDVAVGLSQTGNGIILSQTDEFLGGPGFDWMTYAGTVAAYADLANIHAALAPGDPGLDIESFVDVEALSGGNGNDRLKGDDRTTLAQPLTTDALSADEVTGPGRTIEGLDTVLGSAGAAGWDSGNILIGGPGSDELEGRDGNDFIDGDAFLEAWLDVPADGVSGLPRVLVPSLNSTIPGLGQTVQQQVFNGLLNPSEIGTVKRISAGAARWTGHGPVLCRPDLRGGGTERHRHRDGSGRCGHAEER